VEETERQIDKLLADLRDRAGTAYARHWQLPAP
jgi:hypothetical protein